MRTAAQLGVTGLQTELERNVEGGVRFEIPRGTDFSSVIRSDVPIVAQHTRLDSRQDANALLSTIAYPSAA